MTVVQFDRDAHRREKVRRLERRNEYLEGERDRLQVLLADALAVAAGQDCQPTALLQVLADARGMTLGLAAMHDGAGATLHVLPTRPRDWTTDELVQLLRETAP